MHIIRKKKRKPGEHIYIPEMKNLYKKGILTRREFMYNATLLGMSLAGATLFLSSCSPEEEPTAVPPTAAPAATAAPAPTATPVPVPAGPRRGGELVIVHQIQDVTDPHAAQWVQFDLIMNVAEYLIDNNQDNAFVPTLAESWEASDDAKTWTFKLRKGIKFNHGPDFNVDDVIFNLERWLDPDVGCPVTGTLTKYLTANDIERVDDYTVKLHLSQPYAGIIPQISGGAFATHILPKDWEGDFVAQPYGTGPFTMEEFVIDERAVFKKREGYWMNGADGSPLPYLDGLRYVYLGPEASTQITALTSGEADMMMLNAADAEQFEGTDIVVATQRSSFAYVYKMRSDEEGAFHDNRLRQAVMACQNRQQILDAQWKGYGELGQDHHVAPIHEVYCPVDTPPRDIDKAKALLAEAGYEDGITFTMTVPDDAAYKTYAQLLKDQCAPAGINLELEIMPSPLFWEVWMDVDMSVIPWSHRPSAEMILETMYRSTAAWNDSHWADEEFDELLTEVGGLVDIEARREVMCKIEKIMQERGPSGLPVFGDQLRAHNPKLQNFRTAPATHIFLKDTWLEE